MRANRLAVEALKALLLSDQWSDGDIKKDDDEGITIKKEEDVGVPSSRKGTVECTSEPRSDVQVVVKQEEDIKDAFRGTKGSGSRQQQFKIKMEPVDE